MAARRLRVRTLAAVAAAVVVLGVPGWLWWSSLLPSQYSVMDMGYVDTGGGPAPAAPIGMAGMPGMAHGRSVAALTDPSKGPADVRVTLVARKQKTRLASGQEVDGYTLNGSTPGPQITAVEGQLVEVRLVNESVPDGRRPALARGRRARRHGRQRGRHPGRGGAGRRVRLPVPRRPRGHVTGTTPTRSRTSRCERGLFGALVIAPRTRASRRRRGRARAPLRRPPHGQRPGGRRARHGGARHRRSGCGW